jgi:hypothetical protein
MASVPNRAGAFRAIGAKLNSLGGRGQRRQENQNMARIGRSRTGFNQTMGPQVKGNWSSPTSDWHETMAEKNSHNWGLPGERK